MARICFKNDAENTEVESKRYNPTSHTINSLHKNKFYRNIFNNEALSHNIDINDTSKFKGQDKNEFIATNENEQEFLKYFYAKYYDNVFCNDNNLSHITCGIALSFNFKDNITKETTKLNTLRDKFKNNITDNDVKEQLIDKLCVFIKNTPLYNNSNNLIVCPPPSKNNQLKKCSVNILTEAISKKLNVTSIKCAWKKEESTKDKTNILKNANLKIDDADIQNKSLIIIDDIIESGKTIDYLASKLKEHKVKDIYAVSILKSLRD